MKKRIIVILNLALCLSIFCFFTPAAYARTGSGTSSNPYILTTPADLASMHQDLSAYYALGADIDMAGVVFEPVGNEAEGAFTGSLDGRGHTISNLTIEGEDEKYVGLFGYLEGTVTDLKMRNVTVSGTRYVGAVAGNAGYGSSITDCDILSGSISGEYLRISVSVGGVVGLCEGEIDGCSNAATVTVSGSETSTGYAGGIVACLSVDSASLTGMENDGPVTNSTATAYTGGIVGAASADVTFTDCANTGTLLANGSASSTSLNF